MAFGCYQLHGGMRADHAFEIECCGWCFAVLRILKQRQHEIGERNSRRLVIGEGDLLDERGGAPHGGGAFARGAGNDKNSDCHARSPKVFLLMEKVLSASTATAFHQ